MGAVMSVLYSTIAFAASIASYTPGVDYSIRPGSTANRLFGVLNAIGDFHFHFPLILSAEVQVNIFIAEICCGLQELFFLLLAARLFSLRFK